MIFYRKDTNKYYLKSYRDKTHKGNIHIKIDSNTEFSIIKKEILFLSETYFQITPLENNQIEVQNLGKFNNDNEALKYVFDTNEYKFVTIGRDSNCSLSYPDDKSFSKIQATLNYDHDKKCWKIRDGSINKPSTNGCWIYATHSYEIYDNFLFSVIGNAYLKITICK
jgi:hypothetical protein